MDAQEELRDTQERLCEQQAILETHFQWIRKVGHWALALLGTCAGALLVTAAGVLRYGWDLSLSHQLLVGKMGIVEGKIVKLEETDRDLCKRLEEIRKKALNGAKASVLDRDPWGE